MQHNLSIQWIVRCILMVTVLVAGLNTISDARELSYMIMPDASNVMIYGRGSDYFVVNRQHFMNMEVRKNIQKLASGLRIVNPSDDPAGFAVAEKMKAVLQQVKQQSVNEEDLRNYMKFVESTLKQDSTILMRMRQLVLRASGGILNRDDRELVQSEIDMMKDAIDHNARFATFNTKKVIPDLTAEELGVGNVNVVQNPGQAIEIIDNAMNRIRKMRSRLGAQDNILKMRIQGKQYYYINLQAAESGIRDLDMASEIRQMMTNKTLLKVQYGIILYNK